MGLFPSRIANGTPRHLRSAESYGGALNNQNRSIQEIEFDPDACAFEFIYSSWTGSAMTPRTVERESGRYRRPV
jgi:hypothetical protein